MGMMPEGISRVIEPREKFAPSEVVGVGDGADRGVRRGVWVAEGGYV